MKKITKKFRKLQKIRSRYQKVRQSKKYKEKRRVALKKNAEIFSKKKAYEKAYRQKKNFYKNFYKQKTANENFLKIEIPRDFGLEHNHEDFFKKCSEIIDSEAKTLEISFENTKRIWPSGIVTLVSLVRWIQIVFQGKTKIYSKPAKNTEVDNYLNHCGYYHYVGRKADQNKLNSFSNTEIVKIVREKGRDNTDKRRRDVSNLVKNYGSLNEEQFDEFNSIVLPELFNNVTEHGLSTTFSDGWFILAQCHERTGIISICLADNGIGIKNSLLQGTQKDEVKKKIGDEKEQDSKFIKASMKEENHLSGFMINEREEELNQSFLQKFSGIGQSRGNGLKRATDSCKNIGVELTICSQTGYFFYQNQ